MAQRQCTPLSSSLVSASTTIDSSTSLGCSSEEDNLLTSNDITSQRLGAHQHQQLLLLRDSQEEEPSELEVVMCVVSSGGRVGLSFYQVDCATLYVMTDAAESEDMGLFKRVLFQVRPMVVLISSKVDSTLQKVLEEYTKSTEGDESKSTNSTSSTACKIEVLPSTEFKYETCKRRIISLPKLPGVVDMDTTNEEQRLVQISSVIPLDAVNMVRSVGVLVKYLEKKRVGIQLEETSERVPILAIKMYSLDNLMIIDENTYCSLQIFHKEIHPSVYKAGKGGTKEGLSLFGIANRTKSKLGHRLLKLWFLRPLCDLSVLSSRQDAIEFLMSPQNEELAATMHSCVKQIRHVSRILVRMNNAAAAMNDWLALYKTAYNGIFLGDICRSLPKKITPFKAACEKLSTDLQRVASLIDKVVDFDESAIHQRFSVKPNVDEGLDQKRAFYAGLPDLMTTVASQELKNLENLVSECSVVYFPQLGYLLALPKNEVEGKKDQFKTHNLEFVFETDRVSHYKSDKTREMDLTLGDTQYSILDHESAIMYRLQEVILEQSGALLATMETAAELDCLLSLAQFAKEHNLVRPKLTQDNVLYIKQGRHPLQELCVSPFVPNDSCFDMENGRMKILTGPNASGKSVYLKQVGLIVFLAHIGSFVPAEGAMIGLMDHIFTRIHTRESVSLPLSTFMIDLNQVANALNHGTARSLIIMDEFGKGTATVDGLSLLTSTLRHWLREGEECPNIMVSTHFHSLVQQNLLPSTRLVEYLTMDTVQDEDELVFLYQLVRGKTDTSYACHVAASMGLDPAIVKRGVQVTEMIRRNIPITKNDTPSLHAQQKTCAAIVSRFLDLDTEKDDLSAFLKECVLPMAEGVM